MLQINNIEENEGGELTKITERKPKKSNSEILVLSFKLMLIVAFVVAMLAFVNAFTAEKIAENELKRSDDARYTLFPTAFSFDKVSHAASVSAEDAKYITEVYQATVDNLTIGYCVSVYSNGFGGKINMIVGISTEGTVVGVKIISQTETAGIGDKIITSGAISSQFTGISSNTASSVSAISGATITSNAVITGVNRALKLVDSLLDRGTLNG